MADEKPRQTAWVLRHLGTPMAVFLGVLCIAGAYGGAKKDDPFAFAVALLLGLYLFYQAWEIWHGR